MFCKNCGNQLRDQAAFCPKCGAKVTRKEAEGQEKTTQQESAPGFVQEIQKPKKKAGFIVCVGVLVVIAGIGVGAAVFLGRGNDEESKTLAETSDQQTEELNEIEEDDSGWNIDANSEAEDGLLQSEDDKIGQSAETSGDRYAVFGITQGITEDYAASLDTNNYRYYNSGVSDFRFFYPADLYGEINYSDEKTESVYGTNITTIDFVGSEGSELIFSLSQYQSTSIEDMTEKVYNTQKDDIADAADIIHAVYEDHGRIIMTGFTGDGSKMVYDLTKVDAEYVMRMQIVFPVYRGNADKFQKDYVTECLYRLCGFSGSTSNCRSYEKYKEENMDLEAEIEKIQEWYYSAQDRLADMDIVNVKEAACYMEDGNVCKIVVPKGTDGIAYAREYSFVDGNLYFAFVYDGNKENRLYFVNNMLVRYIDEKTTIYDLEDADAYVDFASVFRKEAYQISDGVG